jgi:hypothetical protein
MVSRSLRFGFVVVIGTNTESWGGSCVIDGGANISWFPNDADTRSGKARTRKWDTRMAGGYTA